MTNQQAISHLENMKWLKGYDNTSVGGVPLVNIIDDIIALLREQETTFVKELDRTNHYHCEKCGYVTGIIARMHKFCPECGRKVMWE